MALPRLISQLSEQAQAAIRSQARLPDGLCYTFDADPGDGAAAAQRPAVYKTTRRTVVGLRLGCFQAREVVRQAPGGAPPQRCEALATLVGKGMRYDYELIVHVGLRSFLDAVGLGPLQQELASRCPAVEVPTSSLYDLRGKFLFLLGALHRQAAAALGQAWQALGPADWLIDGTLEPGTPLFFGIQEAHWGVLLGCWKVPSEKADDLAPCLGQAAGQFGLPARVVHDLGSAMALAAQQALPGVPRRVCHFHFARDVGTDLYYRPQLQLSNRLRALGLQVRLHDQRKTQTQRLRRQVEGGQAQLVLGELLAGQCPSAPWDSALAREVLLAVHGWIMDYPKDGRRQGYPFDPHLLYLHRRLVKAADALDRLATGTSVGSDLAPALGHLRGQLSRYRDDPEVTAAAALYEQAHRLFERLRTALRLAAVGDSPLNDRYQLPAREQAQLRRDLATLREEASRSSQAKSKTEPSRLYGILSAHLERYWPELGGGEQEEGRERTTNALERRWLAAKQRRRQAAGRGKLTREFRALPGEYLLVGNLQIQEYVEVVLGSLEKLPQKLAEAARSAGAYSQWRRGSQPLHTGRLARRLLARENFLDHLLQVCDGSGRVAAPVG